MLDLEAEGDAVTLASGLPPSVWCDYTVSRSGLPHGATVVYGSEEAACVWVVMEVSGMVVYTGFDWGRTSYVSTWLAVTTELMTVMKRPVREWPPAEAGGQAVREDTFENCTSLRLDSSLLPNVTSGMFERSALPNVCLLYTSPSPRDRTRSRMPSSA